MGSGVASSGKEVNDRDGTSSGQYKPCQAQSGGLKFSHLLGGVGGSGVGW